QGARRARDHGGRHYGKSWHYASVGPGSVFFERFFSGLGGQADTLPVQADGARGDGVVTVEELASYLRQQVRAETNQAQNPILGDLTPGGSLGGFFFLNRARQVRAGIAKPWEGGGRTMGLPQEAEPVRPADEPTQTPAPQQGDPQQGPHAPEILDLRLTPEPGPEGKVIRIDIEARDRDGDAMYLDFQLLEASSEDVRLQGAPIEQSPEDQRRSFSLGGAFNCRNLPRFEAKVKAIVRDRTNRIGTREFRFACHDDGPANEASQASPSPARLRVTPEPARLKIPPNAYREVIYNFEALEGVDVTVEVQDAQFFMPSGRAISALCSACRILGGPFALDSAHRKHRLRDEVLLPLPVVFEAQRLGLSQVELRTTFRAFDAQRRESQAKTSVWIDF
nr:hypothetical protein [Thermoanaerobaculia bacterium]